MPSFDEPPQMNDHHEDPPPIGRTWNRLYAAVILTLAVLVVLFYVFTKAFS